MSVMLPASAPRPWRTASASASSEPVLEQPFHENAGGVVVPSAGQEDHLVHDRSDDAAHVMGNERAAGARVAYEDQAQQRLVRGQPAWFIRGTCPVCARGGLRPYGFLQRLRGVPPLVPCHVWPVRGSGWRDCAVG